MRRYGFPASALEADGATPAHRPIPLTRSAEPTKPTVTRKIDMRRAYPRTTGVRSHTPKDRMKVGQSLMRAVGFAMASAVGVCAFAQDYPARPVRMIVGRQHQPDSTITSATETPALDAAPAKRRRRKGAEDTASADAALLEPPPEEMPAFDASLMLRGPETPASATDVPTIAFNPCIFIALRRRSCRPQPDARDPTRSCRTQ